MKSNKLKVSVLLLAVAAGLAGMHVFAEGPSTQPSATADTPATKPSVSADAQSELDAITAAYGKLSALDLVGTIDVNTDIDGQAKKESSAFKSSFQSPVKFRHEMKDDLIVGNTGEKLYIFAPDKKLYLQSDAPKTKADFSQTSGQAVHAVEMQNPALFLALSNDAGQSLIKDADDVKKIANEKLGDKDYAALSIKTKETDLVVLVDPATHYVRQYRLDLKRAMEAQGAPNVKVATATFDYSTVAPNNAVTAEQFAWTPPEDAKDASTQMQESLGEAAALLNKPAIDFTLEGLDGKKVSLADLKGQVFILDFWATWCGPCKMSLPNLDKLYQSKKGAGLKMFAIDQQEDKQTVQEFVTATKLGIPVLLDPDGKVNIAYSANAIPETVLVGKDGIVKKVIVGYDESDTLKKAVEAELAGK